MEIFQPVFLIVSKTQHKALIKQTKQKENNYMHTFRWKTLNTLLGIWSFLKVADDRNK